MGTNGIDISWKRFKKKKGIVAFPKSELIPAKLPEISGRKSNGTEIPVKKKNLSENFCILCKAVLFSFKFQKMLCHSPLEISGN